MTKTLGIHKPFKPVYFVDDTKDYASWSYEVVNIAKIFAERGHDVYMLSETDLKENSFENIHVGKENQKYDRIILFSGHFKDKKDTNCIEKLRKLTPRLDFFMTDLRLNAYRTDLFDNIYTQTAREHKYGAGPELRLYECKFKSLSSVLKKKTHGYYFGGGIRNRLADFLEYVWRPDCTITGRMDFLGLDTRLYDRNEYRKVISTAKYSIVIADIEFNEKGFVSPRHYENIMNDIVSFVDYKWDPDGLIVKNSAWNRVHSYKELKEKMMFLESSQKQYIEVLKQQRHEIKTKFVDGSFVYSKLK